MKTWTETLTLAALAATLTLACEHGTPADMVNEKSAEEQLMEERRAELDRLWAETLGPQQAAALAAYAEIRRTFSVADFRARRWQERWPEIWGPEGWDVTGHFSPEFIFRNQAERVMRARYGAGWHSDDAVIEKARMSMNTELDRYLFGENLDYRRKLSAVREKAQQRRAEEVKR